MQGFIFGGSTGIPTVEALKKRREIADLLAQQSVAGVPQNTGEGIAAIGKALAARYLDHKLGPQEEAEKQRVAEQLMQIQGALGAQGISPEQMTGLGEIAENPYAPTGAEAIARSLMRRQVTPPSSPAMGFAEGDIPQDIIQKYQGQPQQQPPMNGPQDGSPFGWTDPGEIPPDQQSSMMLPRMSGTGQPLDTPPMTGPQVAQADTRTATDAAVRDDVRLTEAQSKDLNFWNRMDAVTGEIDQHIPDLTAAGERMKDAIPFFGNMMVSDQYQVGRRAANEFITALLRKDTGAQVTAEEWRLYGPLYIPQPGDGEPVLKAKSAARRRAIEGMKAGLGIAEVLAEELLSQRQSAAPAEPDNADAELFKKYGLEP